MQKIANTIRTVLLTLNVVLLGVILIESYINDRWDTVRVLMIAVTGINILYFFANKPKRTDPQNANTQEPGETSQGN